MKVLDYPNDGKPAFVYTFEMYKYANDAGENQKPQGSQEIEETKGEELGFIDSIIQFFTEIIDFWISVINAFFLLFLFIFAFNDTVKTLVFAIFHIWTLGFFLIPPEAQTILLTLNMAAWIMINITIAGLLIAIGGGWLVVGIPMLPIGILYHVGVYILLLGLVEKLNIVVESWSNY